LQRAKEHGARGGHPQGCRWLGRASAGWKPVPLLRPDSPESKKKRKKQEVHWPQTRLATNHKGIPQ
jgi:hypothetical protein